MPGEFTLTPGLMFAAAFTSVLLMPTFASTPTFGFTLMVRPEAVVPELEAVVPLVDPDVVPVPEREVVPDRPLAVPEPERRAVVPEVLPDCVVPEIVPLPETAAPLPEIVPLPAAVPEPAMVPDGVAVAPFAVVPLAVAPLVTPVPGTVPRLVIVPTDSSGVQSICTGLFEFSFALPVL